jgi:hypothetical protein
MSCLSRAQRTLSDFRSVRRGLPLIALFLVVCEGCDRKDETFFEPISADRLLLPDQDAPFIGNVRPRPGLGGPIHTDKFFFFAYDSAGRNGARPSGLNPSSVRASLLPAAQAIPVAQNSNQFLGSLNAVPDGSVNLRITGSDSAGNQASNDYSFLLKNTGPRITHTLTPQVSWQSNSASADFNLAGTVTDPHFALSAGAVYQLGPDNLCGTNDDTLWPQGTAPGQVSRNMWDYTSMVRATGGFNLRFTAYNPLSTSGQPRTDSYCIGVTASDSAKDVDGNPFANMSKLTFVSSLQWQPQQPTVGSIAGTVTVNGTPASGLTVRAAGQTTQTAADGSYSFTQLAPASYVVDLINLPPTVVCTPASKSTTVTAGVQSRVDFACVTQAQFSTSLELSYKHGVGMSWVCAIGRTSPGQPNAAYTATVTGAGIVGSGQHSGNLDAAGNTSFTQTIVSFGVKTVTFRVGNLSIDRTIDVTAAPGSCQ